MGCLGWDVWDGMVRGWDAWDGMLLPVQMVEGLFAFAIFATIFREFS